MTINTTACHVIQIGNDVTTTWNFDFVPDSAADLRVFITDPLGVQTELMTTEYDVFINPPPTGGLWGIGGYVTYPLHGSPLPDDWTITIGRFIPYTQNISIANQGAFYPQAVEQALDILEMQIQQIFCEFDSVLALVPEIEEVISFFQNLTWDYPLWVEGATQDAEIFTTVNIVRNLTLVAGLPNMVFTCDILPTANTTVTLLQNASNIGTIVFHTDGSNTVTFTSDVNFENGDQFIIQNQSTADVTIGNISFTFIFKQTN